MARFAHSLRCTVLPPAVVAALAFLPAVAAEAQLLTIEPDDYAAGTALTNVSPHVSLWTLKDGDVREPLFAVTAAAGDSAIADLSPTGTLVFSHAGIPFFNTIRKLEADFVGTTSSVSIMFAVGNPLSAEGARLEVYGESGNLLEADVAGPLNPGAVETLSVTRPAADIARAVIYSNELQFGRFDALVFNTPVPEPGALGVAGLAAALLLRRRGT